jgi:tripartite motif-containing protein 71
MELCVGVMTELKRTKKKQRTEALKYAMVWGGRGIGDGEFVYPTGLYVGMDGSIYVCEWTNHRIQCFTADGIYLHQWGVEGSGDGQFDGPEDISGGIGNGIDSRVSAEMMKVPELCAFPPGVMPICAAYLGDEDIYVCDVNNHRIQVFNRNGTFLRKWGSKGHLPGQFGWGIYCGVSDDGMVSVADSAYQRVQVFDGENGQLVRVWDCEHVRSGLHYFSVTPLGFIWIADWDGRRVLCYQPDGSLFRSWRSHDGSLFRSRRSITEDVLFQPAHIATDSNRGLVYLTDSDDSLFQFRDDGTLLRSWNLKTMGVDGSTITPCDMAAGRNGRLYITDSRADRVYVINTA